MAQLEKTPRKDESQSKLQFGEGLGQLLDYCFVPHQYQVIIDPRDMQSAVDPKVLELIAREERNPDPFKTHDQEHLIARMQVAELDIHNLANWSLWEAFKYVTRFVVDRELAELRADLLPRSTNNGSASQFEDIVALIRDKGIVASIVECDGSVVSWIGMCYDPDALIAAHEANEDFERRRGSSPST